MTEKNLQSKHTKYPGMLHASGEKLHFMQYCDCHLEQNFHRQNFATAKDKKRTEEIPDGQMKQTQVIASK